MFEHARSSTVLFGRKLFRESGRLAISGYALKLSLSLSSGGDHFPGLLLIWAARFVLQQTRVVWDVEVPWRSSEQM